MSATAVRTFALLAMLITFCAACDVIGLAMLHTGRPATCHQVPSASAVLARLGEFYTWQTWQPIPQAHVICAAR